MTNNKKWTVAELESMGLTHVNLKNGTARFMSVDMAIGTAVSLSGDDDNKKKSERQAADADRDATDKRLEKYLVARGKFQDRCLADPKIGLLPTDLDRMRDVIADDGHVYSEFRHAGKPRTGEPNIKFGGFVGGTLKAHNVVGFVKLAAAKSGGWLKAPVATAKDGASMCEVDGKPYHAQKDADANHKSAGCDRAKCTVTRHGDNANRGATYDKRSEWGERGWHVEYADGKRENISELEWDTVPASTGT